MTSVDQAVCITRHGHRIDADKPQWGAAAKNPYDPWLSPEGIQQAKDLAKRLRTESITCIYSSPFLRTLETTHYLALELGIPVRIEHGLSEWLNADWFKFQPALLNVEQAKARFANIDSDYKTAVLPKFPETWEQCYARCAATAWKIVESYSKDIVLVGHGASVHATAQGLVGNNVEMQPWYCSLTKVVRRAGHWALEINADIAHLTKPAK